METTEKGLSKLSAIIEDSGLEESKANAIREKFSDFEEIAMKWTETAKTLVVTDVTQKAEMKLAREGRLFLKEKRVDVEKTRKALKEQSLKEGRAIDDIAKYLTSLIEPTEAYLEQQEKFEFLLMQEQKRVLNAERTAIAQPYYEFIPANLNFGDMSEDDFNKLMSGAKLQQDAKIEAERQAEELRLENDRLDRLEYKRKIEIAPFVRFVTDSCDLRNMSDDDYSNLISKLMIAESEYQTEQEQIRFENERLKYEQQIKEQKIQSRSKMIQPYVVFVRDYNALINLSDSEFESELNGIKKGAELYWEYENKKEQELKAEREKQAKLEAELKAKQDAEIKAEKERVAEFERQKKEADKLAKAPIKKQLSVWVNGFILPETEVNNELSNEIKLKFEGFKKWSLGEIDKL